MPGANLADSELEVQEHFDIRVYTGTHHDAAFRTR
jgi:hypothetical protein